jgi:hypothetical protein
MFSSNTTQVEGGYQISRSLRFNSADSAYLNRTPASAGSRTTWTWSAWVKRSTLGAYNFLFNAVSGNSETEIIFTNNDTLQFLVYNSGATAGDLNTTQVFRDVSAWYHICVAYDSTNATSGERMRMYVNGSRVTVFSSQTYPAQNTQGLVNSTISHTLGTYTPTQFFFNGYMTEVNFIDGQALTPSSFGETNAQTGVWQPKAYSGSYGTNGFYLNFSDNSNTTAATLGKDYSGNGNNWTPNNFSVTAGAGNDSFVDSPTSYGTDTGVGGTVRGNYATFNPIATPSYDVVSNGSLYVNRTSGGASGNGSTLATMGVSSGKWYWEIYVNSNSGLAGSIGVGIVQSDFNYVLGWVGEGSTTGYYGSGSIYGTGAQSATAYTTGDTIGVALDMDARTVNFYKNNVSAASTITGLTGAIIVPAVCIYDNVTASFIANFGQRPFAYTAPSGYKALCTQNLPTPTIGATTATQAGKYYNAVLYTGNGTARSITGVGFQPDWVWYKLRDTNSNSGLFDAVRGATKRLISNTTDAEDTTSGVTSFDSDGFSLGTGAGNTSGFTFVAWNWKANGSGSTNTAGSITSTVSANTTSGFSIVTYTGSGTSLSTVGHGLGAVPSMFIVKARSASGLSWYVYQKDVGNTKFLELNDTAAPTTFNLWESTNPTSSVFTISNNSAVNGNGTTFVAYCFAPIAGYSAFGSYTGNGSTDGPFVFTGMRPAYVMIKRTDTGGTNMNWIIWDTTRNTTNVVGEELYANLNDAGTTYTDLDILSNGFKFRNSTTWYNASGGTYIYMAFASNPFKYSLAR